LEKITNGSITDVCEAHATSTGGRGSGKYAMVSNDYFPLAFDDG
jgi:hypothetical protein